MSLVKKYFWVFFVSMVPLVELRGAIPIAFGMKLPILPSYIVAIIGNMLPVPIIFFFAKPIHHLIIIVIFSHRQIVSFL